MTAKKDVRTTTHLDKTQLNLTKIGALELAMCENVSPVLCMNKNYQKNKNNFLMQNLCMNRKYILILLLHFSVKAVRAHKAKIKIEVSQLQETHVIFRDFSFPPS